MITLIAPSDGSVGTVLRPMFSWTTTESPTSFVVQIATDADFSAPLANANTTLLSHTISFDLNPAVTYFWRVGQEIDEQIEYSVPRIFVTGLASPSIISVVNDNLSVIGEAAIIAWTIPSVDGVTQFAVSHGPTSGSKENTNNFPVTQTSATIAGLPNNAARFFSVKAVGSVNFDAVESFSDNSIDAIVTEADEPVTISTTDFVIV